MSTCVCFIWKYICSYAVEKCLLESPGFSCSSSKEGICLQDSSHLACCTADSCRGAARTSHNSGPNLNFTGTADILTASSLQTQDIWTNLGTWSEDRKIDHKQFVRHSVFQLLSRCASFCIPGIFPTVRKICHVFKQNASSHAQSWQPLSFTINFSFLGNRSSHYPPEALTVFSFIAFKSPSRIQSR